MTWKSKIVPLMTQAIRSGDLSCSDTTQSRFRIDPRWTVVNRGDKMVVFSLKRVLNFNFFCFFTKLIQLLFNKLQFLVFKSIESLSNQKWASTGNFLSGKKEGGGERERERWEGVREREGWAGEQVSRQAYLRFSLIWER